MVAWFKDNPNKENKMNRLLWFTLGGITTLAAGAIITALKVETRLPLGVEEILKTPIDLPEFEPQTVEAPEGNTNA